MSGLRIKFVPMAALVISALLLQGCSSVERDQAATQRAIESRAQQIRAMAQQINERCAGYGFQPGTTAFSQCLQNEVHQAEAIQQSRNMMIQQGDAQAARDQQEQFRRAQCYATGRLDCL